MFTLFGMTNPEINSFIFLENDAYGYGIIADLTRKIFTGRVGKRFVRKIELLSKDVNVS